MIAFLVPMGALIPAVAGASLVLLALYGALAMALTVGVGAVFGTVA